MLPLSALNNSKDKVESFLERERTALQDTDPDILSDLQHTSPKEALIMSNSSHIPPSASELPIQTIPFSLDSELQDKLHLSHSSTSPNVITSYNEPLVSDAMANSHVSIPYRSNSKSVSGSPEPVHSGQLQLSKNSDESVYIHDWRQKREEQIAEKDKLEKEKHKQILEKAQKDVEAFYDEYRVKYSSQATDSTRAHNATSSSAGFLNSPIMASKGQTIDWAVVFKRIDSTHRPKGSKDITRMRGILSNIARQNASSSGHGMNGPSTPLLPVDSNAIASPSLA